MHDRIIRDTWKILKVCVRIAWFWITLLQTLPLRQHFRIRPPPPLPFALQQNYHWYVPLQRRGDNSISPLFYFMQVFKRENFFEEKTVGIKRKNKAFQKSIKKSTPWKRGGGLLWDEKGIKKCRFCPGKLPNCLTSILFSSSSLFMEFFFQTTFAASKCQEKGEIFHNEKDGSQQFPHYSTPLFLCVFACIVVALIWGGFCRS